MSNIISRRNIAKAAFGLLMAFTLVFAFSPSFTANGDAHAVTTKPDKVVLKDIKPYSATSFKVYWYKASSVKGYQVRYSKKKSMENAEVFTSKSSKTLHFKATKLDVHTKYYVQVRAYRVAKSGKMVKGSWSNKAYVYTNYSISYKLDGGKQNDKNRYSYNSKSPTITLYKPTRKGYLFLGWWTNSSFVGNKVTSIPKGSKGSKKFYARWVSKTAPSQEFIFKWCSSQGMTKTCAAAIVGNAQQESGCNPESYNKGGKSYGLFQWTGGRFNRLKEIAESKGRTWKDLECQLILLMEELTDTSKQGCFYAYTGYTRKYKNGTEWGWKDDLTFAEWAKWTNIAKATTAFEQIFERASIPRMDKRISYAQQTYALYK